MTPDFSVALDAASLASLAYGMPNLRNQEAAGIIRVNNGIQDVGVAGTENFRDFLDDFDVDIVHRDYGGWVFKGGADYSDLLLKVLIPVLKKDLPVRLSGHSLGGQSVVDIALHLHSLGYQVIDVHTFAAPPAGMESLAKAFAASGIPCTAYEHVRDLIPRINPILGASKVGDRVWIEGGKWYSADPGENLLLRMEELIEFPHHMLAKYIAEINALTQVA